MHTAQKKEDEPLQRNVSIERKRERDGALFCVCGRYFLMTYNQNVNASKK